MTDKKKQLAIDQLVYLILSRTEVYEYRCAEYYDDVQKGATKDVTEIINELLNGDTKD